jgi:hypothetical protein
MKRTLWRTAGILAAGLIALTTTGTSIAQAPEETWQVEIDIFSGLPNPVFTLTSREVGDIKARLATAKTVSGLDASAASIRPSRLGYRGVVIRGKSADGQKTTADIELYARRILRRAPAARAMLDDAGTGIERMLVDLAMSKKLIPPTAMQDIQKILP